MGKANAWQDAYNAVLGEADRNRLCACIEHAEAQILVRLDAIREGDKHRAERQAIADALAHLNLLKESPVGFVSNEWQHAYDAVLREAARNRLCTCIEYAEAQILIRLDAIKEGDKHCAERKAIADALAQRWTF